MTTADFTADELATLARFDATPAAPESWGGGLREDSALREGAAREMWAADVGLPIELLAGETPEPYYPLADAALAVFAAHHGQQQTAIDRVKELATTWEQRARAFDLADDRPTAIELRLRANAVRSALGADL